MPKLPGRLLKQRLQNEIKCCKERTEGFIQIFESGKQDGIPSEFKVMIKDVFVPVSLNLNSKNKFEIGSTHQFLLSLDESYPYKPPVVKWLTPIIHPNIQHPLEGGAVCLKQLKGWHSNSQLYQLIQNVVHLLIHPNPKEPFDTPSCTLAAEILNGKPE